MMIRIFDLETTGFTPDNHAPCEIGFADLVALRRDLAGEPCDWRVEEPQSYLCHPGRPIPAESSAIHHIVDADVEGCAPWREMLPHSIPPKGAETVAFAAHNAKFERQWIGEPLTGAAPWICTYKCALRLWPDAPGHSNQTLRYWLQIDAPRAIADNAHRAGPDALVTAHILRRMLETPGVTLNRLIEWSDLPALLVKRHINPWRGKRWSEIDDADFLYWILRRDFSDDVLYTARQRLDALQTDDDRSAA